MKLICHFRMSHSIAYNGRSIGEAAKIVVQTLKLEQMLNRIKSVHELQNLYFTLTGKELKIKEDEN